MIEAVTQSLNTLKLTYRSVLILRCFDQRSYAEIAVVTGGTGHGSGTRLDQPAGEELRPYLLITPPGFAGGTLRLSR